MKLKYKKWNRISTNRVYNPSNHNYCQDLNSENTQMLRNITCLSKLLISFLKWKSCRKVKVKLNFKRMVICGELPNQPPGYKHHHTCHHNSIPDNLHSSNHPVNHPSNSKKLSHSKLYFCNGMEVKLSWTLLCKKHTDLIYG